MGKKKSYYKKRLKSLVKGNRTLIAALSGVASGIAIAGIFGTEKAKEMLQSVENNVKDFSRKVANGVERDPVS